MLNILNFKDKQNNQIWFKNYVNTKLQFKLMSHSNFQIYTASAGSGKTFTLAKDYLKILLTHPQDDAYKSILAITFTKKAVEEMKLRILDALEDFASSNTSKDGLAMLQIISKETQKTPTELKQKAKKVLKHLLHHYGYFEVSTIDKFTHRIIRTFSNELKLSHNFQVNLEFDAMLEKAIDNLLYKAGDDDALTKQFVDFTLSKIEDEKSWNIKFDLKTIGKALDKEQFVPYIKKLEHISKDRFIAIQKDLLQQRNQLQKQLENDINLMFEFLENNDLIKVFSRATFINHLRGIMVFKNILSFDFEKYNDPENIAILKKEITQYEGHKTAVISKYQAIYELVKSLFFIQSILNEWSKLSLIYAIEDALKDLQLEENILPIKEFNKLVNEQIQGQPAPFIYEKLGERYKHFFIDEFQDTSRMQWQNLIPLISNALDAEDLQGIKGSLMLVGDPKQSIYRFRGSQVEQMIELIGDQNPFSNHQKEIKNLAYNYRSFVEIVSFNNQFFTWIAHKFNNTAYQKLYQEANQTPAKNDLGYVKIEFLEKDEESNVNDLYLIKTKDYITQAITQGYNYADIAVLIRSNKHGKQIAKYLVEHGLPITSSDSLLIDASDLVLLLVNFIRFIEQKNNQNAKTELLIYFAQNQTQLPLFDFVLNGLKPQTDQEFQDFLVSHHINFALNELNTLSLYQQVSYFVSKTLKISQPDAYVLHFMQMVFDQNVMKLKSATEFLVYWNETGCKESIEVPSAQNAINIMTFHKSKGLEFPVVILPYLNYALKRSEEVWFETAGLTQEVSHVLLNDKKSLGFINKNLANELDLTKEASLLDQINALYVALTRAREQLYVVANYNFTQSGDLSANNIANFFVEFLEHQQAFNQDKFTYEFGKPIDKFSDLKPQETTQILEPVTSEDWHQKIKIATRESQLWISQNQDKRDYGNLIHQLMASVNSEQDLSQVLQIGLAKGWFGQEDFPQIQQTISLVINHQELKICFDKNIKSWNERRLITSQNIHIPDKVSFINQNTCIVIDYKTGKPLAEHQSQINTYAQVLEMMGIKVQKKHLVYLSDDVNVLTL